MSPAFVDRLRPLVLTGDVAGVQALLESLDVEEVKEARGWFERSSRWLDSIPYDDFGTDDYRLQHSRSGEARWIVDLCAVRLCGPATAARRMLWGEHWSYRGDCGERALLQALVDKDRDWAATFVEEASGARLSGNASGVEAALSRVLRAVGRHHQLPCPTGATFYEMWLAGCPEDTIEECLANDPWMPDLLYNYLASGHCGGATGLPEAITALRARGVLDRRIVLARVLSVLTAPQRPASQRMLAKILASLDPAPEEIAGGLDYLLGVMSTSAGAVGRVLLPPALALVTNGDELAQLTGVVAARSEKDQKKRLLAGLKALPGRIGTDAVLAALDVLAMDEDAAFADQARSLAARLGPRTVDGVGAPTEVPGLEPGPLLGLWTLEPTRHRPLTYRSAGFTFELEVKWPAFLVANGRSKADEQTSLVNEVLTALADGRTDHLDGVMDTVLALLAGGNLVLSRFTNLLPDLFLGGGMREVWPRALAFADTCARRLTPPATLADLLRTLARFAPEAPRGELPPHLALLAARKGTTKAQVEARVLGAALAGTTPEAFRAALAANPPQAPVPRSRGLWRHDRPTGSLPEDIPLKQPEWSPEQLAQVLRAEQRSHEESRFPLYLYPADNPLRKLPHAWIPELVLAATVRAVYERGAGTVRRSLVDIERRNEPLPIVMAIDLWAAGLLDTATYWRLAEKSEGPRWQTATPEWRECWGEWGGWGRVGDLTGFTNALARDPGLPLLRPQGIERPLDLAMFLRACECLLLAERHASVLATPTWFDGTLELDDLLVRLKASGEAGVGPLDLVQALYRLRPCDPKRADELPLGRWFTDAALTTPEGGPALDAGAVVRHWVAAGGLPPLELIPAQWSGWESRTLGPVPWSTCVAAPAQLDTKVGILGSTLNTLRTFPLWPDLAAPCGVSSRPEDHFPAGVRGPFGKPLHADLLCLMTAGPERTGYSYLRTFVLLAQLGRLDPAVVAEVMALPRQRREVSHHRARDEFGAFANTFRRTFESGGMAGSWPTALAIAAAGLSAEDQAGLDEYLRMLADFASEVPAPRATAEVLAALNGFSEQPIRDGLHEQARILVAALQQ